jgi:hypothetical protein
LAVRPRRRWPTCWARPAPFASDQPSAPPRLGGQDANQQRGRRQQRQWRGGVGMEQRQEPPSNRPRTGCPSAARTFGPPRRQKQAQQAPMFQTGWWARLAGQGQCVFFRMQRRRRKLAAPRRRTMQRRAALSWQGGFWTICGRLRPRRTRLLPIDAGQLLQRERPVGGALDEGALVMGRRRRGWKGAAGDLARGTSTKTWLGVVPVGKSRKPRTSKTAQTLVRDGPRCHG